VRHVLAKRGVAIYFVLTPGFAVPKLRRRHGICAATIWTLVGLTTVAARATA
jgi:hypothetical protein